MARGWAENPIFQSDQYSRRDAWVWMIERACWQPTKFDIRGTIITLERGQFCASRDQLAKAWGWSTSAVERYLTRLETGQMIGRETGQGKSVITLCNYEKYQDPEDQTGQPTGQPIGQTSDRHRTANKQGNKETILEDRDNLDSIGVLTREISKKNVSKPKPKMIPLPNDWQPEPFGAGTRSAKVVDGWPPGEIENHSERFRSHHASKATQFANWQAAWGTWVLNTEKFAKGQNNGSATHTARRSDQSQPIGNAWLRAAVDAAHGQSPERGYDP